VAVRPARFTPERPGDGKFDGSEVRGVRLEVTDPALYDPTRTGVALLLEARRLSADAWEWRAEHFDRLAGTHRLRVGVEDGVSLEELVGSWRLELQAFAPLREASLLYP
jgi:uncharacterized protein YbbC (DUF1343 family)